ncbi:hypothetical protein D3C81_1278130 [compost metagenome]
MDGVNFYRFVRNSPVNFVDDRGHFPILRYFLDYRLEKNLGIRHLVQQRGMKNIRKHSPEMAEALGESLSIAKGAVRRTANKLTDLSYDKEKYLSYFGVAEPYDDVFGLAERYQKILSAIERIEINQAKLVVYYDPDGDDKNVLAFVGHYDRRNKIYINGARAKDLSVRELALTLIHELSHQDRSDMALDYYYLHPEESDIVNTKRIIGDRSRDDVLSAAMERKSRRMMMGNALETDLFVDESNDFILAAKGANLENALHKFNDSPDIRSRIAVKNADSLAGFAMSSAVLTGRGKRTVH